MIYFMRVVIKKSKCCIFILKVILRKNNFNERIF